MRRVYFDVGLFLSVYAACMLCHLNSGHLHFSAGLVPRALRTDREVPENGTFDRFTSIQQRVPASVLDRQPTDLIPEMKQGGSDVSSAAAYEESAEIQQEKPNLQVLTQSLNSDQPKTIRLLAITSLLNMAQEGHEVATIKAELMQATSDQDARVAMRARRALDSLSNATSTGDP